MEGINFKKNKKYKHYSIDIRNKKLVFEIFKKYKNKLNVLFIFYQYSHDKCKRPFVDFKRLNAKRHT